ncbi:alkaline phosphatase family protein [Planctomicrobium piriforme]|uniref:Type I phosphodiesterase / nucleotide pyrophosphatase n=1 Tax=Planctomicrobium piriforme TaxID=1576369 RepID=A0A1I3JXP0_9PLAN|nr:alkaline phosphatase family protein [Planctomicrobium piriforme]SFI64715.1 Type I phosphodiesterase / nucleotide pyrophosphatase [Planctomicrobium piriforme]
MRVGSIPSRQSRFSTNSIHSSPVTNSDAHCTHQVARRFALFTSALLLVLLFPSPGHAYIGPGAGFALAGSFLAVLGAFASAVFMLLLWPVRQLARVLLRRRPPGKPRFKRVVILGLDGLDHGLTHQLLTAGKLPNLAALQAQGDFKPLGSTLPPISPVAWSSFQTGVNPGKHNIFDFLIPDQKTYQPRLSSVEIRTSTRTYGIGPFRFSIARPDVRMLRKSKPFWGILSQYGIFNCIIRVPITFPPEKLHGVQLSAMCVPDLRGTQGTFSRYTTAARDDSQKTGGETFFIERVGSTIHGELLGPPHPIRPESGALKLPFTVTIKEDGTATLTLLRETYTLIPGAYSGWIPVRFSAGWGRSVRGICRFLLLSIEPQFELYVTPINLDPEKPPMAIGYPRVFPTYLAKRQGPFATLGLAEDTWGLSEQVLEDCHFLKQCQDIDAERETMFFDSLEKVPQGLCVCVFDGTDRMQHMFWRYHDPQHPARPAEVPPEFKNAIEDLYIRMDDLVGRTMTKCAGTDTLLMVLSDHGFNTFRRGVDLNRWLEENGYLVVDDARRGEEHLAGIDWTKTQAFAIGLTGIFLNLKGKFEQGIVEPGAAADALVAEIAQRLGQLVDPVTGQPAIKRVYAAARAYRGPYTGQAPDLIVGYASGYRVSWDAAVGKTSRHLFQDNTKAWSGDHCVDPSVVPGVLFCSHRIESETARLLDIAPTVLELFGIPTPDHMDGRPLTIGSSAAGKPQSSADSDRVAPQVA